MEPGDIWSLFLLAFLLGCSAFFSASETALMSLSKIRIRNLVDESVPGAQRVQQLVENPSKLLGAILIGNNIVNIGASALATSLAIKYTGNTGVGLATGVMTVLVLVFGEVTPKTIAAHNSEQVSLRIVNVISLVVMVLKPFTYVLVRVSNVIIRLIGGNVDKQQPFITEDELKTMINVGHEEGVLENEETKMINNVFEFGESRVRDVMTPRVHLISIEVRSSYDELMEMFKEHRFSRVPVYDDQPDNVIGVLYLKDLLFVDPAQAFDLREHVREPYFTFEFKLVTELFKEMRDNRIQIAIVLDEYGGTSGIITIEDLVEEIVGDIHDESDDLLDEIEVIKEDEYVVRGITQIDVINEMLGIKIESEDFDSIGGFVTGLCGKLPSAGEVIAYNGNKFMVESVRERRIEKLRIYT